MHQLYRSRKPVIIVFSLGLAVSLLMKARLRLTGLAFISDMLFTVGMFYVLYGLVGLVSNSGSFNGFHMGTRWLLRMVRGKQESSTQMKEEYAEYVRTRPKRNDIMLFLVLGAAAFALSLLVSIFGVK